MQLETPPPPPLHIVLRWDKVDYLRARLNAFFPSVLGVMQCVPEMSRCLEVSRNPEALTDRGGARLGPVTAAVCAARARRGDCTCHWSVCVFPQRIYGTRVQHHWQPAGPIFSPSLIYGSPCIWFKRCQMTQRLSGLYMVHFWKSWD